MARQSGFIIQYREFAVTVRVRLAPSPTGNLHIGTARTAVFNWLFARHNGGQFILRIEDTDQERSRPEYTQNILDGLNWLGLTWDAGPFYQSQRLDYYKQMIQTLLDKGLAYRCYVNEEELNQMREEQKAKNQAPRYDNRHRNLTQEQREAFEAEGRMSVIRFIIDDERVITWNDLVRGPVTWKASDLGGDMVIARAAGPGEIGQPLYNLAVVVDDIDMRITHVIRGEDHISNTPKQILLYEAFGANIPEFAHTPLILNKDGQKLSKRDGVTSISEFKQLGYTPEAMVNYMTLLGWSPPDNQERFTLEEAAKKFSFERVNKAGAKFDWDKLNWLNSQYLQEKPISELTELLIPYWQEAGFKFDPVGERPWLEQITALIGPSLKRLSDAVAISRVFFLPSVELHEEAAKQLQQEGAMAVLAAILAKLSVSQPLTETSAGEILNQVAQEQTVKKGLVMRTLRAALTGEVHGPDLVQSWLILHQKGFDRARLQTILGENNPKEAYVVETPNSEPSYSASTAETPASENPTVLSDTPAAKVGDWNESATSNQLDNQFQQVTQQILDIFEKLPDYLGGFFNQYSKPLTTLGLIVVILISLRVLFALLDVFNSIPLLGPTFELVGIGYTIWFVSRYLLTSTSRQELYELIKSLKEQVAGQDSGK